MRRAVVLALSWALSAGCNAGVRGSATIKSEPRTVADFDEIAVSSGIHAVVKVGDKGPIELRGDDNLLPLVTTEVSGHRLRIGVKTGSRIDPSSPIVVTVPAPDAKALDASSGASIEASGVNNASCGLSASGGARLKVSGTTGDLDARASSGSRADAGDLKATSVKVEVSSGASLEVNASGSVQGSASSGGSIRVKGKPATRDVSESSGGNVKYD